MKTIAALLFAILILLGQMGCNPFDDRAEKDEIFRFAEENVEQLEVCIETGDFGVLEGSRVVEEVNLKEDHIEFYCGGAGFGSQTAYCGFYYTDDDDMHAVWCAPPAGTPLTGMGQGFSWQEEVGDNRYYTEHICGHFYYYEASF